jgi:hypothetical protein
MSINARDECHFAEMKWKRISTQTPSPSFTLSFYPQIIFISNTVLFDGNSKHFSFSIPHAAPFFHIISMEVGGEERAKSCIKLKINFANDNKCQPVGGQYIRVLMFPLFRIIKKIKIFSG